MGRSPMLFAPPLPPLMLPGDGTVVIGRSHTVDLCLSDPDTSRRHAEIVCAAGHFVVRDLGSTNGTWVNGSEIQEYTLKPGDRIEIGSQEIAFCEIEGSTTPLTFGDDAQTNLVERSVAPESFRGDLAEIPTFALLQVLEMGRKTGVLTIDSGNANGRLWLQRGDPIHAEVKGQVGFDAAVALVNADRGRFGFEPVAALPERTIEASVTELLLEASRRLDEGLVG